MKTLMVLFLQDYFNQSLRNLSIKYYMKPEKKTWTDKIYSSVHYFK